MDHFKCIECDKILDINYKRQYKTVHNYANAYKCFSESCLKIFQNYEDLSKHLTEKHQLEIFICDICQKPYQLWDSLQVPVKTYSRREDDFRCEHCGKSLYAKRYKLRHESKCSSAKEKNDLLQPRIVLKRIQVSEYSNVESKVFKSKNDPKTNTDLANGNIPFEFESESKSIVKREIKKDFSEEINHNLTKNEYKNILARMEALEKENQALKHEIVILKNHQENCNVSTITSDDYPIENDNSIEIKQELNADEIELI